MNKKRIARISIIIALLLGVSVFAAERISDIAKSTVSTSNLKIELLMLEDDGEGNQKAVPANTPLMPGQSFSRIAMVRNIGKEPAWIRIKARLTVDGYELDSAENAYVHMTGLNDEKWTLVHSDDWALNPDDPTLPRSGYWYYNEMLEPGETTEPLFTGLDFPADGIYSDGSAVDMNGAEISLNVNAEGTQSKNNGSSAVEAKGWPEE